MEKQYQLTIHIISAEREKKKYLIKNTKSKFRKYQKSFSDYIYESFQKSLKEQIKRDNSVILFRNKELDERAKFDELKIENCDAFQIYVFPNSSYKPTFQKFLKEENVNIEQYYYSLIQANGDEEKAHRIAKPGQNDLNQFVEKCDDFHNIFIAYSEYNNLHPNDKLGPRQYLKVCKLKPELYKNENIISFLENYDSPFRYKKKIYEYYLLQLNNEEYEIVNDLLYKHFNITFNIDDKSDSIAKAKELVLNTYMSAEKDKELTDELLGVLTKDI